MDRKKRARLQNLLMSAVSILCFSGIGAYFGYFLVSTEKKMGSDLGLAQFMLFYLPALVLIFVSYYVNICLHEAGHAVFGVLTGYKFLSIRFGSILISKADGKLKISKYNLAGTGGQALLLPPKEGKKDFPVVLYNLGGLIVNLVTFVLFSGVFLLLKDKTSVPAAICVLMFATAFTCFITNALPLSDVGVDGANTLILRNSAEARLAFRNSLEIYKLTADGVSILDMPEELLAFDRSIPLEDPLVTAQALNRFNLLMARQEFDAAKECGRFILENTKSIVRIHEVLTNSELLFIECIKENKEEARRLFAENGKALLKLNGMLSVYRALVAYYTLAEPDEKRCNAARKKFDALSKSYPFVAETKIETELLALVEKAPMLDNN